MLVLVANLALAADDVPSLADGINKVSAGTTLVLQDGTRLIVPAKSWLLPDPMYREAIAKAKQLDVVQPALDLCTDKALYLQEKVVIALDSCEGQFKSDAQMVDGLVAQVGTLETRALVAEEQNRTLRNQRNVAWALAGGLVVGAVAVTAVAVVP